MNFTAVRRSESEIQALLESGEAECLTVARERPLRQLRSRPA